MKPHIVITLKSLLKKFLAVALIIGTLYTVYRHRNGFVTGFEKFAVGYLAVTHGQWNYTALSADDTDKEATAKVESEPETKSADKTKQAKTTSAQKFEEKAQETTSKQVKVTAEKKRNVSTRKIDNSGASQHSGNVYAKNLTDEHSLSIDKELARTPDIAVKKDSDKPQVLIMHTHTTESYMPYDLGYYSTDWATRSDDKKLNMVAVGKVITKELNKAGIKTVHSDKIHDHDYSAAYDLSCETVEEYLEKYPSIKVVLDIHRDAITDDDGTKLKPTVEIKGKNAAQLLIISGCEEGKVTDYPDWEYNLRFAVRLQKQLADDYPGLVRPMHFAIKKYNQHLTHGSLLIEMGSEANTLDEAKYSAKLLSKSLVKLFDSLSDNE